MNEYVAVPAYVLEDRKEKQDLDMINRAVERNLKIQETQKAEQIAFAKKQEERSNTVIQLAAKFSCGIAGIACLVYLERIGAVSDWLMYVLALGLSFWAGREAGLAKE